MTKTFSIRIDDELLKKLKERAKKENRSLNNLIITLLQKTSKGE